MRHLQNKVRGFATGLLRGGTQLSSGSYRVGRRHREVLPEALPRLCQLHTFLCLCKWKKYTFYILSSAHNNHACLYYILCTIYLGCTRDHALVPSTFVHLKPNLAAGRSHGLSNPLQKGEMIMKFLSPEHFARRPGFVLSWGGRAVMLSGTCACFITGTLPMPFILHAQCNTAPAGKENEE